MQRTQEQMEVSMALRVQCAWRRKQGRFSLFLKQRAREALEEEQLYAASDIERVYRELGNNKGKKTDLQRWMEQIFQSFDLPNKFHDLFALLNVVPGRVQGKTAKQAGVT